MKIRINTHDNKTIVFEVDGKSDVIIDLCEPKYTVTRRDASESYIKLMKDIEEKNPPFGDWFQNLFYSGLNSKSVKSKDSIIKEQEEIINGLEKNVKALKIEVCEQLATTDFLKAKIRDLVG